ncbi:hypothetical protein GCM10010124_00770 [Pilimelia terevasa]|uniref:Uncharacterized protein n=1 Tax=Pilimelia terevasa TaxID=53372 RepID=A0A8J3BCN4_9ACTN|nr:ABC transporter permease [Pilimelia terevasa]GGK11982.1 hypothetical protein GCM10010124_00770 [Pilimelia terevasa]
MAYGHEDLSYSDIRPHSGEQVVYDDPAPAAGGYDRLRDFRDPAPPARRITAVPAEVLDRVFDDPEEGEPGRDRMRVHLVWEGLLLVALAAVGALLYRRDASLFSGAALADLLVTVAGLGLLALAADLSLRAGAVNLAIGPVAVAAGIHVAEQGDRGTVDALTTAGAAALAGGLVLGLLVGLLHVPGWAATAVGALGAFALVASRTAPVLPQGAYRAAPDAVPLAAAVGTAALLLGLLGATRGFRRLIGRYRPVRDPALRRGGAAAVVVALALAGSTALAAAGGVVLTAFHGTAAGTEPALRWTGLALGIALLAGVSAYGRRGGVAGTLLATGLVAAVGALVTPPPYLLAAGTLLLGLAVTRLVERYGRPSPLSGWRPGLFADTAGSGRLHRG